MLGVRLAGPFLLRSVDPPLSAIAGRLVDGVERLGKRIVVGLADQRGGGGAGDGGLGGSGGV